MGRKLNKVIGVLIIGIIFFMSTGYSVLNRELSISGDLNYRPNADIRITNITQKSLSNATIQYADFSKNEINIAYNAQTTSASVSFEIEITNYTDIKMGILKIDGLNGATIEGYNLKHALSNAKGPLTKGESATFTITFKASTTGIQQNLLTIYFEEIYKISYTGLSNIESFKTEVMKGDSFSQIIGIDTNVCSVTMNESTISNYNFSNGVITISNVTGDIVIDGFVPVIDAPTTPNAPVLNGDMLPVYYDNGWKKADISNTDNNWYDYTNQKWANAVTITESGYKEKKLESENVDLINQILLNNYKSTNQGKANKTSNLTLNFTAGSEGGILSFDYKVSSEKYDKLTLKVTIDGSTETLLNAVGEIQTGNYTKELSPNAKVTIVADYKKDPSGDKNEDTAYITNLSVPAGSTAIVNNSTGDYPWMESGKYYVGKVYEIDSIGKFILSDADIHDFSTDDVGKYICPDGSAICTELYEITSVVGNTVKNVNKYSTEKFAPKETYKTASEGTRIYIGTVSTMWVWIPRYSYTIKSEDGTNYYGKRTSCTIPSQELPGEIDVKFITTSENDTTGSAQYTGSTAINWRTNEAFNFPETDENEQNTPKSRAGIWVGKFELTQSPTLTTCVSKYCAVNGVTILPNQPSIRRKQLYQHFYTSFGISYGFDETKGDLHMMKNDEWGAVAYLSQSRYGKYGNSDYSGKNKEIYQNKSATYTTGSSNGTPSQSEITSPQYEYNDMKNLGDGKGQAGPGASTTGTVYGIYDMSGGTEEFVMGVLEYYVEGEDDKNGQVITGWQDEIYGTSGFKGVDADGNPLTSSRNLPNKKYYNTYKNVNGESTSCNGGVCYGHALLETQQWYIDSNSFIYRYDSWFIRGGNYDDNVTAGIFNYSHGNGGIPYYGNDQTSRFVLT